MKGLINKVWKLSSIGLLTMVSSQVFAGGYKLEFESPSVLADAGEAAVVEDASTNWYNSAGLVYLPLEVAASGIEVFQTSTFTGNVNAPSTLPPPFNAVGIPYTAHGSASTHPASFIPAVHYAIPVRDRLSLGLSITPAWGLLEDYGEASILRYNLTRIYTRTLDFAPSIAYKINDQWSIGAGPDFHYFSVESKTRVRTQSTVPFLVGTTGDSISRFSANRWGYGGHVGVLYRLDDHTRFGLNYRSQIYMNLDGFSDFAGIGTGLGAFESNSFKLPIPLPATSSLSAYHDMTPCWAVMGTIAYDHWSSIRNYNAKNYIQPPTQSNPSGIIPNVIQPQYMTNTVDVGIGTHLKLNPQWMLRGSLKYVATPTVSAYRAVSFPDGPKLGINLGAKYQITKKVGLNFIYAHVFTQPVHINDVNPVTGAVATGHSTTTINLIGLQAIWDI